MSSEKVLDVSWSSIFKIAVAFLLFYLIYIAREILVWTIFGLVISLLFNPAISFFQRYRIPRGFAIAIVYGGVFIILGFIVYWIVPLFIAEFDVQQLSQLLPQYFEKIAPHLKELGVNISQDFEGFTMAFQDWLNQASASIFSAVTAIFGGIFSTVTILSIAVFLSLEEKGMEKFILLITPKKHEAYILDILTKSETKVASWFGTRLLGCLFIGVATFIAAKILAIKYAVSFSVLAAILNIIPFIGPIITGAIFFLFTVVDSWSKTVLIIIVFTIIQQLEGNILMPVLAKKLIGLPPILVLISLLVGAKIFGLLGAILVIPLTGIIFEFVRDFLKERKDGKATIL